MIPIFCLSCGAPESWTDPDHPSVEGQSLLIGGDRPPQEWPWDQYGWAQAGRSPRRTGYNPEEFILSTSTVGKLRIIWSKKWAAFAGRRLAQPVVWRDIVVVRTAAFTLATYSADSGFERWGLIGCCPAPGPSAPRSYDSFYATPAIGYGIVVVPNNDGVLAFATKDGAEQWRAPPPYMDHAVSDPLAADGQVYVTSYRRVDESRPEVTLLWQYDARTGQRNWSVPFPGARVSDPASAHGIIYLATEGGYMHAVDATNGSVVWTRMVAGEEFTSPAVMGGRVFISSETGKLFAFDADTGTQLWMQEVAGTIDPYPLRSPVVDGQSVYLASAAAEGIHVEAFSVVDGRKHYTRQVGRGAYTGDLGGANGVLYLGEGNGSLYALDARDGSPLLVQYLGDPVSAPVISNGHVFVGTDTNVFGLALPPPNESSNAL